MENERQKKLEQFDPSGVGIKNGNFIGLPFDERTAQIILLSIPWEVTVSYTPGTASGPQNILEASYQLDLFDLQLKDAWKTGIYMRPSHAYWLNRNDELREMAETYIEYLEEGGAPEDSPEIMAILTELNQQCKTLKSWVKRETEKILDKNKLIGLVGGEHSIPLGFLEALAERHEAFGILQIDAHMDLREAYEGFEYSHASIFYNALKLSQIKQLVQVGIRDFCQEEYESVNQSGGRIRVYYDEKIKEEMFKGVTYHDLCEKIIESLPEKVYISFDIDGLQSALCPNTGTPVPGGLDFQQAMYLLQRVVESGRTIIGFDLCEVGGIPNEFDGNVGARILYRLCNLMAKSQGGRG
jgi:agmatinase